MWSPPWGLASRGSLMSWGPPTGGEYWPPPPRHLTLPLQPGPGQWTPQQLWGPPAGGLSMPRGTSPMSCRPPAAGGSGQV
jgi:hypothetical protein